jgi:RimJ/RimL family protein N-acetyltransferase
MSSVRPSTASLPGTSPGGEWEPIQASAGYPSVYGEWIMIDAANYNQVETLKNGAVVRVRSIRADDKNRISEAFRNLETESVYTRFFQHKKTLTDAELKTATEVDFENVVALVVTIGEGESETIIGAGRYAAFEDATAQRTAEVAFTVEEDYHGQGMAGLLLRHLTFIAVQKGESQFEAEVLPENKAMLAVFSRSGLPMKKAFGSDAVHVTLSLTGAVS